MTLASSAFRNASEHVETPIPGCYLIHPRVLCDQRGSFTKTFGFSRFLELGFETQLKESYFSISHKDVLRGFHFQLPPHEHAKIVYCLEGEVLDAALDLRTDSPTFGKTETFQLTGTSSQGLYLPAGLAHAFYTLSEKAIMLYYVTSEYSSSHDRGIHYDSVGVRWPNPTPIISDRDRGFPSFSDFKSPFRMKR